MKKIFNKELAMILSLSLLLLLVIGTTVAYIYTATNPVKNSFEPSQVACAVVEDDRDPVTGSLVYIDGTKENVKIKNTGDTDAYIRVAVAVNWASEDGTRVWAQKPVEGTDYTITYNLSEDGWFNGGDGFYYYSKAVSHTSPNNLTDILISNAALMSDATAPVGTDNTQYYLSIEIVASAIQSAPAEVVKEQWNVSVDENGSLSRAGGN